MSEIIRIRKGLDINLEGKADKIYMKVDRSSSYALKPTDFVGILPKLNVKPGDKVNVGTPLFFDKRNPQIRFTSPVSGTVSAVTRGERRKILEVVVDAAEKDEYLEYKVGDPANLTREQIIDVLLESGMWTLVRQRPFSVIANPEKTPRDIFISGFDSAPLAPDIDFILKDFQLEFQKGVDVLSRLTDGKIHLSVSADYPATRTFSEARGVEMHFFKGPHPAGNPGIQIHHIAPVNKGDIVWYIRPQDVISIGKLFMDGKVDNSTIIALAGSEVNKPVYYKVIRGASITPLVKDNVTGGNLRYISGNVLTGTKILKSGYLGYYDNQVTVIPEGDHFEFLGWALPGFNKFSVSRSFFSWMTPGRSYKMDTNLHGGRRAYVMTGEYEKVFPMDIYPVHLIKAILVEDVELMERLGIYEVSEEDFALCEFVCTSKTEVQQIIRHGLDVMRKETE